MGFENGMLVRVTLRATKGGRQEVNTLHYDLQNDAVPGAPANDPQSLADTFRDDVMPHFAHLYKPGWEIQPVVVVQEKDPLNPTAPRSEWTSGVVGPGTADYSGADAATGLCAVATLLTANIGRRFRGRVFIGGDHSPPWIEGNNWQAGALAAYAGAFLASVPLQPDIASGPSDSTANWCVYSRTQRAANLDPYASHITAYALHSSVHWLRRRANIN